MRAESIPVWTQIGKVTSCDTKHDTPGIRATGGDVFILEGQITEDGFSPETERKAQRQTWTVHEEQHETMADFMGAIDRDLRALADAQGWGATNADDPSDG